MIAKGIIQNKLSKSDVRDIIRFLSYHIGYVPPTQPTVVFAKTAREFAGRYEDFRHVSTDVIEEVNKTCPAFYEHLTNTIVFQGFSYLDGAQIKAFAIPMATVIHEFIHFFQYSTGQFGPYSIMYEGTNDLLSCFLVDDYNIDYRRESKLAFNLIMEICNQDFWETINWIKRYTVHSDKSDFLYRSIKQCKTFSRYNPSNLMKILEAGDANKIVALRVYYELTRHDLYRIKEMMKKNKEVVKF